jgi:hypothetical protein
VAGLLQCLLNGTILPIMEAADNFLSSKCPMSIPITISKPSCHRITESNLRRGRYLIYLEKQMYLHAHLMIVRVVISRQSLARNFLRMAV